MVLLSFASRVSEGLDVTVPPRCPATPQKDQQDPPHRAAGFAEQPPQLLATQAGPGDGPVAQRPANMILIN